MKDVNGIDTLGQRPHQHDIGPVFKLIDNAHMILQVNHGPLT